MLSSWNSFRDSFLFTAAFKGIVSTQPKCKEVSRVTQTLWTRVAESRCARRGGSLFPASRRRKLSKLNRRLRGASGRAVNKSERRVPRATYSWLAFVTGDRVYMTVVYTPGFNFAFNFMQNCEVGAAMRSLVSYVAADESICDLASEMRATVGRFKRICPERKGKKLRSVFTHLARAFTVVQLNVTSCQMQICILTFFSFRISILKREIDRKSVV